MKILILANNDCGLFYFRRELIEKLVADGHEVVCNLPEGDLIPAIEALGARFIPCRILERHGINPLTELKLISYYKALLRAESPDIVFTYTIKPNCYGGMACAKLGIPYVANITGLGTAVESGGLMQAITLALYKRGLRGAQKVFFQNEANRDFMIERSVVSGPYEVLPGSGVNLEQYRALPYPDNGLVEFLFIARVMEQKGIEQYLDAADYIVRKYPNTRFHVCGTREKEYSGRIDECIKNKTVIYHGQVNDIVSMHCRSSCTIHPTFYPEGLSNVLLESCASARPIITTNRAGCREVVRDGVNGYVVKEKDSNDLIKKIELFLSKDVNERRQMGINGRILVEQMFDRRTVVEKYCEEIRSVIRKAQSNNVGLTVRGLGR